MNELFNVNVPNLLVFTSSQNGRLQRYGTSISPIHYT